MPYIRRRPGYNTRRRPTYRRRYPLTRTRLNRSNYRSFSQNQNMAKLWITRTGFIAAVRTGPGAGNILERYGTQDLPSTNMFINACTLYEQYKTVKMVLTIVSCGNRTSQNASTSSRGNLCTYIDTPPLPTTGPPVNFNEVCNNSSFRLHNSDSHMMKRFVQRPSRQYPRWALINRNATGTPLPDNDEWVTTMNVLGNNYECANTAYTNIFYFVKMKYCVLFKCRSDE